MRPPVDWTGIRAIHARRDAAIERHPKAVEKHTPGPWMVEAIRDGLTYQVTTSEQSGFKVLFETAWGDDEDKANATAAAAIPDLIAALVAAKQEMWLSARDRWTMADFKNWAVIQQIDAALTLATGVAR